MIDYSNFEKARAQPAAAAMIENFRAIGYNIETAIADIIDNSISANANNIWIDFEWKGSDSWLSIKDNGTGMNNEELIQAMRPGSRNPNELRNANDLGRFGMGLKTASFSQCRKLSVVSKKIDQSLVYWRWDIDFVNQMGEWDLIKFLPDQFAGSLDGLSSGTIIIWNDLDRLVNNLHASDKSALEKFLQIMEQVKKHLSMVFHRFIEKKQINIFFQQREIDAWDPFLYFDLATQKFPEEPLLNKIIIVRGFVLPHKSKLTEEEYKKAEGPKGWNEQQGFYIYRNERLLLAGDWLGMFRKEEHYKLARIMIDLPNNQDSEWQIDIKKSVARPPIILRDQLRSYANKIRAQAVEVYRHKGQILQRKYANVQFQPVWQEKKRHGKRFYEINRVHPLVSSILESLNGRISEVNQLLRLVEETIPVPLITIKESEEPEIHGQPFENTDQEPVLKAMKQMYGRLISDGRTPDQAKSIILNIEPFNLFPEFTEYFK